MKYEKTEIDANNILIADTTGWEKYGDRAWKTPFDDASYCNGEPTHICDFWNLKFNTDWRWLMEAIATLPGHILQPKINPQSILETWENLVISIDDYESDQF